MVRIAGKKGRRAVYPVSSKIIKKKVNIHRKFLVRVVGTEKDHLLIFILCFKNYIII